MGNKNSLKNENTLEMKGNLVYEANSKVYTCTCVSSWKFRFSKKRALLMLGEAYIPEMYADA